ncbi:MAG: IPT/TIG domain-containing protein, partial [Deltaproteobacteria bacterium]|nr:IPT/TIG domain-containing protein [Deltaproteobacteria bacterium]
MRIRVLVSMALSVLAGCSPGGAGREDGGTAADAGPSLKVSSVTPATGPAGGGTALTVTGSGFADGVALFLGDKAAAEVVRVGENRLTAKSPPASVAGVAVDVRVVAADGTEAVLPAAFQYDAAPGITEAVLGTQLPAVLESLEDAAAVALTAEVNAPGRTEGAGAPAGVRAQFGVGPAGSAPAGFTWVEGAFLSDGAGARDVFSGSVQVQVPLAEGATFDFAARFSLDGGATWSLAAPVLTATVRRPSVQWCKLGGVGTGPEVLSVLASSSAREVYVQLYHPALTEQPGAAAGLEVEWG